MRTAYEFILTKATSTAQQLDNDISIAKLRKSPSQEQCNSSILESESLTMEQSESLMVEQSESLTVEQSESLTVEQSESLTVEQSESLTVEQPESLTVEQSESLTWSSREPHRGAAGEPHHGDAGEPHHLSLPQSCSPTAPSSTSQSLSQEGPYVKKGKKVSEHSLRLTEERTDTKQEKEPRYLNMEDQPLLRLVSWRTSLLPCPSS
ncbi:uro-adherence factor A-like [Silurus meridionalis]|uniref:uro-adherence factor A-like n=1 Tax=Silurus meridionalis TaxID=175797 RepID=UPI001EEBCAD9|nr:uro-adherence factor A-like [Silurus meridionalis]